jgi:2-oxoglutarate ferredoxin oxidoreductase subunit alpha
MAASPSISIAVVGSGGAGALTTGNSLLESGSAGWYGLRAPRPQIRGGRRQRSSAVSPGECCPTNLIC